MQTAQLPADRRKDGTPAGTNHPAKSSQVNISRIILIGAGGGGGFDALHLGLLIGVEAILIIDGDLFERGNTNRQALAFDGIAEYKAETLAGKLPKLPGREVTYLNEFITEDNWEQILADFRPTLLVSAVDNDEARKLIFGKNKELPILWGANELWTPQAGISRPEKPWSPLEAFVAAEDAGTACGIQTVHANAASASMAMMLLSMHASEHEEREKLPVFVSKASNEPFYFMYPNEL